MSQTPSTPDGAALPGRSPARTLAIWAARLVALYAALMLAWLVVGDAYGTVFRGAGDVLLGSPAPDVRARFLPLEALGDRVDPRLAAFADVAIEMRHLGTGSVSVRAIDSRFFGYVPTVVFVCLVLATPVSWRRRGRALAWGLPIVHVLIGGRVLLYVASVISGPPVRAFAPGPAVAAVLEAATTILSESTLASYVLPLLLWALLTFRAGDWGRLFGAGTRGRAGA